MTTTTKKTKAPVAILRFIKEHAKGKGTDLEAARQVLREKCKTNLWFLSYYVLDFPDILNPLHFDMCERWEKRRGWLLSLWMTPRFHLKTTLWTRAGTIQELLIQPDQRILIINAKLDNAVAILADIKTDFDTNEVLRWLFPEYCRGSYSKDKRNQAKWGVNRLDFPNSKYAGRKEGNIEIMGVEASLVSKHYDLLVFDDPVNDVNTATKPYRDKIDIWYKNSLQLRVDLTTSRVRLIGTRWHFDDLYSRLIKAEMAYRKNLREAKKSVKPNMIIYHRAMVEEVMVGGETIVGKSNVAPIWPERFVASDIEKLRVDTGSYIFSCQFMNNPLPEEDAVFKHTDIRVIDDFDIPDELAHFIAVDMAVEESERGDYTVITVAGFDVRGRMYVRRVERGKMLPSRILELVGRLSQRYEAQRVAIETTAFQKTIFRIYQEWAAEEGLNIPWTEMGRGNKSKFKRIIAMQPRVERGDFYVQAGIENIDWLIEEMSTFPRSTHDDILDTLADLEAVFYRAPDVVAIKEAKDTYDGFYGALDDADSWEDTTSTSLLDSAAIVI